jgi:UDP-N-acetylmuramoyl-L-alanyl-D-glutamate--2,6-diaminopimelate ligase
MIPLLRKIVPLWLFKRLQSPYHLTLSFLGALVYRFPSRSIKIVGVTGTKGKTSTVEFVNSVLETAGYKTALASTLRFKISDQENRNLYKMTMPGRFFLQCFLRRAVSAGCDWAILEITSEGVKQWRHKWINLNALIFTNISPEHIEAHGSFEKYMQAKIAIGRALENSFKRNKIIVANGDDTYGRDFLALSVPNRFSFSLSQAEKYKTGEAGIEFLWNGKRIVSKLRGVFNVYNILAAATFASAIGVSAENIAAAIKKLSAIRGRVEFVTIPSVKQDFDVVVDYAHTIDSLSKLYEAFSKRKKICVLGNTGGGRDKWKRKGMAETADKYCDEIILTNEDPYDEDPMEILNQMKAGIKNKPFEIILDRREAIRLALSKAQELAHGKPSRNENVVVLISGKGTDPYIMGPNESKIPWDDATVVREELERLSLGS